MKQNEKSSKKNSLDLLNTKAELYLAIEELLEKHDGFIAFDKPLSMIINNEGKKKKLLICGVVLKYEYSYMFQERKISINNIVLITIKGSSCHFWDMNDYLTTQQMSELFTAMHNELE